MNRPSPDDMKEIIMAEQREEIKELKDELYCISLIFIVAIIMLITLFLIIINK